MNISTHGTSGTRSDSGGRRERSGHGPKDSLSSGVALPERHAPRPGPYGADSQLERDARRWWDSLSDVQREFLVKWMDGPGRRPGRWRRSGLAWADLMFVVNLPDDWFHFDDPARRAAVYGPAAELRRAEEAAARLPSLAGPDDAERAALSRVGGVV